MCFILNQWRTCIVIKNILLNINGGIVFVPGTRLGGFDAAYKPVGFIYIIGEVGFSVKIVGLLESRKVKVIRVGKHGSRGEGIHINQSPAPAFRWLSEGGRIRSIFTKKNIFSYFRFPFYYIIAVFYYHIQRVRFF